MPTTDDLSQSNYLKQGDVDPPITVTIDHWAKEEVGPRRELNFVLYFKEHFVKPMVLKKENGDRIFMQTGTKEFDEWAGTQITLYRDPTIKFGTEVKGGIRVMIPQQQPSANVPQNAPPAPSYPPPPRDEDIPF